MDIEKVFDSLDYKFILAVLKKFGFHENFVSWVAVLLNNQEPFVINSGSTTQYFLLFIYLFIYLFIHSFIYLFVCLFIYLFVYLFICLFIYFHFIFNVFNVDIKNIEYNFRIYKITIVNRHKNNW